jgi:hypothetical protein
VAFLRLHCLAAYCYAAFDARMLLAPQLSLKIPPSSNFGFFPSAGHKAALLVTIALFSAASAMRAQTMVEFSMDKAPLDHAVGTCAYDPTDTEKLFFDRLSDERQMTIETKPGEFGETGDTFTLAGHQGQFVSWHTRHPAWFC